MVDNDNIETKSLNQGNCESEFTIDNNFCIGEKGSSHSLCQRKSPSVQSKLMANC